MGVGVPLGVLQALFHWKHKQKWDMCSRNSNFESLILYVRELSSRAVIACLCNKHIWFCAYVNCENTKLGFVDITQSSVTPRMGVMRHLFFLDSLWRYVDTKFFRQRMETGQPAMQEEALKKLDIRKKDQLACKQAPLIA